MAPPLPNSAHGDQLISAKPRGTARFRTADWLTAQSRAAVHSGGYAVTNVQANDSARNFNLFQCKYDWPRHRIGDT
jgi:hypothetical protein